MEIKPSLLMMREWVIHLQIGFPAVQCTLYIALKCVEEKSPLRFWIVGVFMLIFGTVGLAGNILSIFCLSAKYDRFTSDNLNSSFPAPRP